MTGDCAVRVGPLSKVSSGVVFLLVRHGYSPDETKTHAEEKTVTTREMFWGMIALFGLVVLIACEWIPGVLVFGIGGLGLAASDFES